MAVEDTKAQIKDLPVSQVIGAYIPITKKAADYVSVCPFHNDHSPSMHISDKKGLFKCFSCGAGGDSISFVQRYLSIDFKEALIDIAEKFNIPVETLKNPKAKNPKYELAQKVNTAASRIYRKCAVSNQYEEFNKFLKNRDIPEEIAKKFSLGYAPGDNKITAYLNSLPKDSKDQAISIALEIGLIRKDQKREGSYYDTFRDRVMFPIWDQFNNVVGFGSRAVFDYQKGKYINSQDSFIFNKKNILYGLNFAKQVVRNKSQVILVEGYMDCISLFKNGFENTVAVMGVAMSENAVKSMSTMAKDIILGLDSDNAGFTAAGRINALFMEKGFLPRAISYDPSKDPDDFLQEHTALDLQEKIDQAPFFVDVIIEHDFPETIPETTEKKLACLDHVFKHLAPLGQSLSATERAVDLAKKLGLKSTPEQIISVYTQKTENKKTFPSPVKTENPQYEPMPVQTEQVAPEKLSRSEEILLQYSAQHPECFKDSKFLELLDFVDNTEVKEVLQTMGELYFEVEETEFAEVAKRALDGDQVPLNIKECLSSALFHFDGYELDEKKTSKLIKDIKMTLKKEKLLVIKAELKTKQLHSKSNEESFAIIKELNEIQKELYKLKVKIN